MIRTDNLGIAAPNKRSLLAEIARRTQNRLVKEIEDTGRTVNETCQKFSEFVRLAWPIIEPGTPLRWNWHLDAMCDHLEAISRGKLHPRIIINVPPGSSKSTIVSVLWQAWEWGPLGKPHLRYVSTSFELGNVKRDTAKTRSLIKSKWYQDHWPNTALVTDGVTSFSNGHTGSRIGVAFASVMGKRGDRLIVDDPHSLKGAESEVQRDGATQLFIEGGLNRTNDWETSAIVIVMQRLHANDLTGVLLARDFGFVHLMIPMEFEMARACETPLITETGEPWRDPRTEDGQLMDPARFPAKAAIDQKKAGDYAWNGQYQQRPAPREGGMFRVELIQTVNHCPPGGMTVCGWDFAASKRKTSPYTVRVKLTRVGGDYYIRHIDRRRTTPAELNAMVRDVSFADADQDPRVLISLPQDPGQAGKVQKYAFAEVLEGLNFRITPETGDKETRAEPLAAQVGAGRVYMVLGEWNGEFIEEARSFPAGSYKDQIDALSRAFGELVGKKKDIPMAGPILVEEGSGAAEKYRPGASGILDAWA